MLNTKTKYIAFENQIRLLMLDAIFSDSWHQIMPKAKEYVRIMINIDFNYVLLRISANDN